MDTRTSKTTDKIGQQDELSFEQMYQAVCRKDSAYEGIFVMAVKTTGVFCRPSCRARTPKPENVVFYQSAGLAIQYGYRPCKICKPMEHLDETPDFIQRIIDELHRYPELRIRDIDLRHRGIEPSQVRRWFKRHHNMTFHAYQRMLRINTAFQHIREGKTVTDSVIGSGFDSLSGFADSYRSVFGTSPTKGKSKVVLNTIRFTTPLGPMLACTSEKGVCLLEFCDRRKLETEFRELCQKLNAVVLPGNNAYLEQLQK